MVCLSGPQPPGWRGSRGGTLLAREPRSTGTGLQTTESKSGRFPMQVWVCAFSLKMAMAFWERGLPVDGPPSLAVQRHTTLWGAASPFLPFLSLWAVRPAAPSACRRCVRNTNTGVATHRRSPPRRHRESGNHRQEAC